MDDTLTIFLFISFHTHYIDLFYTQTLKRKEINGTPWTWTYMHIYWGYFYLVDNKLRCIESGYIYI